MFEKLQSLFITKKPENYYLLLGELAGITNLVENFYLIMQDDPKARECLLLHDLVENKISEESKKKLIFFLSGWLGGPNLFVQTYGAPMMRKRHLHKKITSIEKEQWLYCMQTALNQTKLKKKQKKILMNSFMALAIRIENA